MLPFDPDANDAEKLQWVIYQLKVWEKLMVQLTEASRHNKIEKIARIVRLFYAYGDILSNKEFEFEVDKLLIEKEIFDAARELL